MTKCPDVILLSYDRGGGQPEGKFGPLRQCLTVHGVSAQEVLYTDAVAPQVREQLLLAKSVLVWVNPIEGGQNRDVLDALLRDVAKAGVRVNTHPDTILRMGTKQVLMDTRDASFGSDVHAYRSVEELKADLGVRLVGGPKVLKQFRGHSGGGIWKVALQLDHQGRVNNSTLVLLRHAARGCPEETVTYAEAVERMHPYFEASGVMVEQPFQERIGDGMIRVYMVQGEVGGFGHQSAVALVPAKPGEPLPEMGPRLYYPSEEPRFSRVKSLMEDRWLGELKTCLRLSDGDLPVLWDADFMFGPKGATGEDTYILCEINVSCVSPYPEWANEKIAVALHRQVRSKGQVL